MSQKKRRTGSSLDCQDSELEFPHPAITLVDGLIRWKGSNSYEREWQFFKKLQGSPHTYSELQMQYRTLSQQAQEHWKKLYEDFWCSSGSGVLSHPTLTLTFQQQRDPQQQQLDTRDSYECRWAFFKHREDSTLSLVSLRQHYRHHLTEQAKNEWKKLLNEYNAELNAKHRHPPITLVDGVRFDVTRSGYAPLWVFFWQRQGGILDRSQLREAYTNLGLTHQCEWRHLYRAFLKANQDKVGVAASVDLLNRSALVPTPSRKRCFSRSTEELHLSVSEKYCERGDQMLAEHENKRRSLSTPRNGS